MKMSKRDIEYYMRLPYRVEVYPDEEEGYTAIVPELPGCMTCAETLEELWDMLEDAKRLWIETVLEDGGYVPEPAPIEIEDYSGRFVVRLPKSLHRQLSQRAEQDETSLNQIVVMLLSEGMGRWSERV